MLTCSIAIVMVRSKVITRCAGCPAMIRKCEPLDWKYVIVLLERMQIFFRSPILSSADKDLLWTDVTALWFCFYVNLFCPKEKGIQPQQSVEKCAMPSRSVLFLAVKCITKNGYDFCFFVCCCFFLGEGGGGWHNVSDCTGGAGWLKWIELQLKFAREPAWRKEKL